VDASRKGMISFFELRMTLSTKDMYDKLIIELSNYVVMHATTMEGLVSINLEIQEVDLDAMRPFFSNLQDREAVKEQGEVETHWNSIVTILEGEDIWSSERTIGLREYSGSNIMSLASSGHRVKRQWFVSVLLFLTQLTRERPI
jgi:hypothetical protein